MEMANKTDKEKSTSEKQFKQTTTKTGKPRSRYTLKCEFNDGNQFTYRGDFLLNQMADKGYKNLNELDAIILKFTGLKALIHEAKIFDNSLPAGEDNLMHFAFSKVLKSSLPSNYAI